MGTDCLAHTGLWDSNMGVGDTAGSVILPPRRHLETVLLVVTQGEGAVLLASSR